MRTRQGAGSAATRLIASARKRVIEEDGELLHLERLAKDGVAAKAAVLARDADVSCEANEVSEQQESI